NLQIAENTLFSVVHKECCIYYCNLRELFFKIKHDYIYVKPMKGTIHRGKTSDEDDENKKWLQQSAKNKYENKLIVDLMENELAPIATIAGASHTDLYNIETYPTVHQMTS